MTLLTPLAALAALAALVPLAAVALGRMRVRSAQRTLGLQPPPRWIDAARTAGILAGVALLGLAAAQPALTRSTRVAERTGVAALFVLDISRSMAASATPSSPTRLDRAVNAAVALRAAIPEVEAGVATLTDRVLPDLLPVADIGGFDGVVRRAVAIEAPPPLATSITATTYGVLGEIASGDYFDPHVTRRIVILLTDGESNPFDAGGVASALSRSHGYRFLAVRFWNADESVYGSDGRAEPGYHPNPAGAAILAGLASAIGGRSFAEGDLGGAADYLRHIVGTGPTTVLAASTRSPEALTPYLAALALALVLVAVAPPAAARRLARLTRALGSRS